MLSKTFCTFLLLSVAVNAFREQSELEGAKAYTVYPSTQKQFNLLKALDINFEEIDFVQYAHIQKREGRVVVGKKILNVFESLLKMNGIPFDVYMQDVKAVAENEMRVNEEARLRAERKYKSKINFEAYQRYDAINAYLDRLANEYPDKVTVIESGKSYEGRSIKSILISTTKGEDKTKPVIISDGGNHAREWISPAQALYMIQKLVEDVTENDLVDKIDWVIIPLLNPDGYEYSHTNFRMWRKTRSLATSTTCPGVDGNRNFDFQWMVSGSSNNPCSDAFAGPIPFSESETKVLRDIVLEYEDRAKAYIALHSHGSYILYPFGYNGQPTPDNTELHNVGLEMAKAIDDAADEGSRKYLVGNAGAALGYLASGATEDWCYGVGNIKLSYTYELPSGGTTGFDLPPSRIQQVVKETWEGIKVIGNYVIDQYY